MPGSSLDISISTGAPAAFALSLGIILFTKGVAIPTHATPPATEVAATKNFLLPLISLLMLKLSAIF
jgi:hypothetical protein